ncbi:LytR/AlgR family response regulator transcription factor [Rufibacter glacialis]|uniref:Response regulator transcription factor n=1 Tax=Rufibacter glacialis TaxID=1259555 RepID=A0A5M8QDW4_9BACT|nr:LytTR family DNA-binding domain-containing protein [Rufibacter glacialis]KAA6434227.1 response regulator transcription factor [Rufibacter glacialis]GGK67927.1 DNA-binding response regulator [Rufibacter glacialis]
MKTHSPYRAIIIDDDELSRMILERHIQATPSLELVQAFGSSVDGLAWLLKNEPIDLLFLDVEMPEMTGLELLRTLPQKPETILITSHKDFALQAFELQVSDYLLKPVDFTRFTQAVLNTIKKLQPQIAPAPVAAAALPDELFVKVDNKIIKLNLNNISFIEARGDYVVINTDSKKHIVYTTMSAIDKKLPEDLFLRIHRSFIINLRKIELIEDDSVFMQDKYIPIGGSYQSKFYGRINKL